jgi:hypothetical protein
MNDMYAVAETRQVGGLPEVISDLYYDLAYVIEMRDGERAETAKVGRRDHFDVVRIQIMTDDEITEEMAS